ncbi:acyltransferase [Sphingomonas sp.]|uniref:acyltransferase family protein n=1 Tax=Sphingomonas sp. TaxID=28214 RepID=UPI0028A06562|nr:acyltransferase [Sphingomonas sp.]
MRYVSLPADHDRDTELLEQTQGRPPFDDVARRASAAPRGHLAVLDGWRGISILCVLAGHMLPLGPSVFGGNVAVAATGMALFFTLSGFLITTTLLRDDAVVPFIIKRLFRILPLAWLYVVVVIGGMGAPWSVVMPNLLFYANASEATLAYAPHFWSLSLEMQFYAFVAVLVAIGGRRALWLLPLLAVTVTGNRAAHHVMFGVHTLDRIDEIMAGATLALALHRGWRAPAWAARPWVIAAILAILMLGMTAPVIAHFPYVCYLRPYMAASLVGLSLGLDHGRLAQLLRGRVLGYIARISYALYVLHPLSYAGWMGSGDVVVRYTKRIGSFMLAFGGAHLSTFYFEQPLTRLGHRIAQGVKRREPAPSESIIAA